MYPRIIITSVGINLVSVVSSYISTRAYQRLFKNSSKVASKSPKYAAFTSFLFGVSVSILLMCSGIADWQRKKINSVAEMVDKKVVSN